jgi:Amt family ammonium transporter
MGALLTGVLASADVNGNLKSTVYTTANGLDKLVADGGLLGAQLKACALTIVLSVVATVVITVIVKLIVGLRPTPEQESIGLDLPEHGEAGYEH